jgi:hypothetical protein
LVALPPTRKSWTAWKNAEAAGNAANFGRKRLITSEALTLRTSRGFRVT